MATNGENYGNQLATTCQPNIDPLSNSIYMHDWHDWQSERKDRNGQPWIKLHRCIMISRKWALLSDAEKGQLISMWIAAAPEKGFLPANAKMIQKICQLDNEPDLLKFNKIGLIDIPVDILATNWQPNGKTLAIEWQGREEERRGEKRRGEHKIPLCNSPAEKHPKKSDSYSEDFEKFWSTYPKRKGKGAAWKSWKKEKPPLDKCLTSIRDFEQFDQSWREGFVPLPATWLNQHRWDDEPDSGNFSSPYRSKGPAPNPKPTKGDPEERRRYEQKLKQDQEDQRKRTAELRKKLDNQPPSPFMSSLLMAAVPKGPMTDAELQAEKRRQLEEFRKKHGEGKPV